MNIRLKVLVLSSSLALSVFMTTPAMADEFNKRIDLRFNEPMQIPGHVLAPGKYVFELVDSQSDRNVVQVFSKDSDGKESLVATIFAVPDDISNTPDKPIINFEERSAGSPVAIHSWFYPGDNTGWEFVYPKGQSLETHANTAATAAAPSITSATAPVAAPAVAPAAPTVTSATAPATPVQQVQQKQPALEVAAVEEQILIAQNDAPAPQPVQGTGTQTGTVQLLPQTAGNSGLELLTGFAMLAIGLAALLTSRRKSVV
jgi:hypothetical protein